MLVTDEKVLRVQSKPVSLEEGKKIGEEIVKLLWEHKDRWFGLAAVQIGNPVTVAGTRINGERCYVVNPKIKLIGELQDYHDEGCLSFPYRFFKTKRSMLVELEADNLPEPVMVTGMEAVALQHEMDHFNGVLVMDHGIEGNYNEPRRVNKDKTKRNDPCPCGSGKKYKKCCGRNS